METNGINEKLQAQMIEDKRGSHSRTFALIALALIGLSIYIVWRVKQPAPQDAAPSIEIESIPIGDPIVSQSPAKPAPKKELSIATALPPDDFAFAPATPVTPAATAAFAPISPTPATTATTSAPVQMPVLRPDENEASALDNFLPALPAAETQPAKPTAPHATAPHATAPRPTNEAPAALLPETPTPRSKKRSETVKPKTDVSPSFLPPENPASKSATETIHVIRDGDSLPELAARYYGSATAENIRRLRDANPHLKRGGFREGVPLKIPAAAATTVKMTASDGWDTTASEPPASSGAKPNAATLNGDIYTVVGGDTLSAISARFYGTAAKWQEIYALNRDQLPSPNDLQVGMKLKMPQKNSN